MSYKYMMQLSRCKYCDRLIPVEYNFLLVHMKDMVSSTVCPGSGTFVEVTISEKSEIRYNG